MRAFKALLAAALAVALAIPSEAAIAGVQTANTANSAANTCTMSVSSMAAGNLATVLVEWGATGGDAGVTVTSVTDNGSNSYSQASGAFVASAGFFRHTDIWYSNIASGATSVVVHYSANQSFGGCRVTEWSGAKTSSPLQAAAHIDQEGSTGPALGPAQTPCTTGMLMLAISDGNSTGATSVDSPWSFIAASGTDATGYFINPPQSVQQANFQPNGSQPFVSSGAMFLAAGTSCGGASHKKKASSFLVF